MVIIKPDWLKPISEGKQHIYCQCPGQVAREELGMTTAHPDDATETKKTQEDRIKATGDKCRDEQKQTDKSLGVTKSEVTFKFKTQHI